MGTKTASLIIASSETDSNLYYACRFLVPDPVIYFEISGKKHLILSDLELDRARIQAKVHKVLSLSKPFSPIALAAHSFLKEKKVRKIVVPFNFPASYYETLKKLGYSIMVKPEPFYKNRLVKKPEEKKHIRHTLRQTEKVLREIFKILERSKIKRNRIYYGREIVTSEMLREEISIRLMKLGCTASSTIVSSGVQGSYPHHEGSGPIIPHTPIIFDIYPRHRISRYCGDMTRTIVKGHPSDEVKKMYRAVKEANRLATDKVKAGVHSSKVHLTAKRCLERHGFRTGKISGRMQGFIHSTGHGLGLDVHEPPSISMKGSPLKKGNVITIEPGLYYQKYGGVRIEDSIFVTKSGSESLTKFPKFLEIDK